MRRLLGRLPWVRPAEERDAEAPPDISQIAKPLEGNVKGLALLEEVDISAADADARGAEAGSWSVLQLPTDSPAVAWELSSSLAEMGVPIHGLKIEPGPRTSLFIERTGRRGLRQRVMELARAALAKRRTVDPETGLEEGGPLRELLRCSICLSSMRRPVSLDPCAHSFDEACIVAWTRSRAAAGPAPPGDAHGRCPVCRGEIRGLLPNRVLRAIADRCAPHLGEDAAPAPPPAPAPAPAPPPTSRRPPAAEPPVSIGPGAPSSGVDEDVEHVSVLIRSGLAPPDFWDAVDPSARPPNAPSLVPPPAVGIPLFPAPALPPMPPPPPPQPRGFFETLRDAASSLLSSAAAALRGGPPPETDRDRHARAAHQHAAFAHAHAAGYYSGAPFVPAFAPAPPDDDAPLRVGIGRPTRAAVAAAVPPYRSGPYTGAEWAKASTALQGIAIVFALFAVIASVALSCAGGPENRAIATALGLFGGILLLTASGRCLARLRLGRRPRYLTARLLCALLAAGFLGAGGFLLADREEERRRGCGTLLVAYGAAALDFAFHWLPRRLARVGLRRSDEHLAFLYCLANLLPLGALLVVAGVAASAAAATAGERPILAVGLIVPVRTPLRASAPLLRGRGAQGALLAGAVLLALCVMVVSCVLAYCRCMGCLPRRAHRSRRRDNW